MAQQAADEGQCTCGMELGKKLKAIEHLVASTLAAQDCAADA